MQIKETYFLKVGMTLATLNKIFRMFFHFSVVTNISLIFIYEACIVIAVSGSVRTKPLGIL